MAIVINGSGTVTGLAVGGLPDGTVDDGTVASGIASSKLTGALPAISGASLTGFTDSQMPAGAVLQVVSVVNAANTSTTVNAWTATSLSASITPISTSSKVLISIAGPCSQGALSTVSFNIYRDSTALSAQDYGFGGFYGADAREENISIQYLDSPSTTSATTYKLYINRRDSAGTVNFGQPNRDSVITLMEIAG